jgi:hypothetical protein
MRNAVGKHSSTLRTKILILLGIITVLLIHNTYFQLRQIEPNSKFTCVSAFNKPFVKPDDQRRQEGYRIPKSESFN